MRSPVKTPELSRNARWGTPNTAGVSIPHELSFDNVCHKFGDANILNNISLSAKSGSVTCLLGPSGSGKTTLLRIAAGMEHQTSGRVLMDGREISGPSGFLPPEKRGIGLVFQDYALFPHLTILKNVSFGLSHLKRPERIEQALKMLSRVGLNDRANDYPHQLSGGEQQRVALARALAPRPGVLLMDEPFSGLDSRLRDTMREETLGVLRETRATSILVTHDPEEALRMGDQIALLRHGHLEQLGTGRELYFQPSSVFAASFFSELNYFDGTLQNGTIDTPLGPIACQDKSATGSGVAVIRVNSIKVTRGRKVRDKSPNQVVGRVLSVHFTGEHEYLRIGVSGAEQPIKARVRAGVLPAAALEGKENVSVCAEKEGSFAYHTSG